MNLSQLSSFSLPGAGLVAADTVLSKVMGSTTNKNSIQNNGSKDAFADILSAQNSKNIKAGQLNDGQKSSEKMTKAESQIREAARGFERTLVRQMLSSVRSSALRGGEISGMPSSSSNGYLEIADDKLADSLVAGKGMGFAQKVAEQMLKEPSVKALIEQEKKAVNNSITDSTDSIKPISSKTNQYNHIARI
jgi:Rod binding domain-containing protein